MTTLLGYSLSIFRRDFVMVALAFLGIALGISVYGAMRIANTRVVQEFEETAKGLSGKGEVQLRSRSGKVDEELYALLSEQLFLESVTPFSEQFVRVPDLGVLRVLGLDLLGDAVSPGESSESHFDFRKIFRYEAALASKALIEKLEQKELLFEFQNKRKAIPYLQPIAEGSTLVNSNALVLLVDISYFQELFESQGHVDAFLLRLSPEFPESEALSSLEALLPAGTYLESGKERASYFSEMTEAFRLNLSFLAGISLLVAVLLIYNMSSFLLLKRRRDFGILVTLGTSPKKLFHHLLYEAFCLGLLATLLGIFGAMLLAEYTTGAVEQTVNALYTTVSLSSASIPLSILLERLLLGPLVAILGAYVPSREIFQTEIRETFFYQNFEQRFSKRLRVFTILGVLAIFLCLLFARTELLQISLIMGFLSPTFLSIAALLLAPVFVVLTLKPLSKISERFFGVESLLAIDHIRLRLRRNATLVASIALALGMFLGVTIMIESFRSTVEHWLRYVIKADIYISLPAQSSNRISGKIAESFVKKLQSIPSVEMIGKTASISFPYSGKELYLSGERFDVLALKDSLLLSEAHSAAEKKKIFAKDSILVSEAFQKKHGLTVGDTLSLELPGGKLEGPIRALFRDYVSEHGVVLIDWDRFVQLSGQEEAKGVALYLTKGASVSETLAAVRDADTDDAYLVRDARGLRDEVFRIFNQTFQITYALQTISLLISAFILMNALLMLLLERKREFMCFRAIGASFFSLLKMVSMESLLLAFLSLLWGLLLGFSFALLLVYVVNPHFFSWSVQFVLPLLPIVSSAAGVLVIALFLAFLVAVFGLKNMDSKILRYE